MMGRRAIAVVIAAAPALVGAALAQASRAGLACAIASAVTVALLASREPADPTKMSRLRVAFDLSGWVATASGLAISILLSSPRPDAFASPTTGRRVILALAGSLAGAGAAVVFSRRTDGDHAA